MASLINVCVILFVFAGCLSSCADALPRKYISLTSDVQNHYKASSVFFIIAECNRGLDEYTVLHSLSREFSQKGVLTLVSNFVEVGKRMTLYRHRIQRPLAVILLRGTGDFKAFTKYTRSTVESSFPVYLIIFVGESGNPICRYCNYLTEVVFDLHLRFDTEMLVVCCDDPILREWWSNDAKHIETAAFASWTEEKGLKLLTSAVLFSRRFNLNGKGIRIAIVPNFWSFVIDRGNNTIGGFYGEVLHELSRGLNFTISAILQRKTYGSWNASDRRWSGIIGQLVQNNADFGIDSFTMTSHRLDVVDFFPPLLTAENKLYIKKPDGSRIKWSAYLEAFTVDIWLTIMIIIITTPILLAVIEQTRSSTPLSSVIIQNYLYVWGIFCQQGLCEFPTERPLRIAYFTILLCSIVVSSAYCASLTSYLAVSSATLPFTSLIGFMNDGSYKLIVFKGSADYDFFATSTDTTIRRMMRLMKSKSELPRTAEEAWDQVCRERVGFYVNEAEKTLQRHMKCEVSEISTGRYNSLAMIMTDNNQYTKVINHHIQRLRDNGILARLRHKYFDKYNSKRASYDVVGFLGIAPLLLVLGCGIMLAFALVICEQLHWMYLKNKARMWPDGVNLRKTTMYRWINSRRKEEATVRNIRRHAPWQTILYDESRIGYYA